MRVLSPQQVAVVDRWDGTVVSPRDAATVVILRDGPAGRETFLIRRPPTMAFAAGMHVFPGGGVQDSDFAPVPWIGPDPPWWAARLSCQEDLARALVVAAVRELYEETGLLLAGRDGATMVEPVSELIGVRRSLESREITFADFLRAHRLSLRADLLNAWARWITPAFHPRRFDTRFFVAMLPAGQAVGELTSEADQGEWVSIQHALAEACRGEKRMLQPTRLAMRQLLAAQDQTVAEAAAGRVIATVEPQLVEIDGVRYMDGPAEDDMLPKVPAAARQAAYSARSLKNAVTSLPAGQADSLIDAE